MAAQDEGEGERVESHDLERVKEALKEEIKRELLAEIAKELRAEEESSKGASRDDWVSGTEEPASSHAKSTPAPSKKAAKSAFTTVVSIPAYLKFCSHALKYANQSIPRERWVEVIGLLAGRVDKERRILHVEDAYPMGHGSAIYAEIKDYKNFVRAFNDLRAKGLFVCGWYHSHPSYGLFMSEEDLGTQTRYQRLWSKSIAVVVDPYLIDGTRNGFQVFRADIKRQRWYEVPFRLKGDLPPEVLPELLDFIAPITDGRALYLEYDEA
ncbi:MAG: hypothetical protein Kow0069_33930 [Promethearchaeota archaeon]